MGNMEKRQRQVIREMGASTVPIHLCNTSLKLGFINIHEGVLTNQLRGIIDNSANITNVLDKSSSLIFIELLKILLCFVLLDILYFMSLVLFVFCGKYCFVSFLYNVGGIHE